MREGSAPPLAVARSCRSPLTRVLLLSAFSLRRAIKEAVGAVTTPSTRFKFKLAGAGLAVAAGAAVLVR